MITGAMIVTKYGDSTKERRLDMICKANIQIKKNAVIDLEMVEEYLENDCETEEEENV